MLVEVLKSKIHRVTVTEADLNYIGSITIDEDIMDAANVIEGEKVQVVNINNGERLETYIIKGERGSGNICLNGPAARRVAVGDVVIIISYAQMDFEKAKQIERRVVNFMKTHILPLATRLSNTGLDKLLACVGGWGPISEKVLWPYEGATLDEVNNCLLYTSPSPRDLSTSRMPSSA